MAKRVSEELFPLGHPKNRLTAASGGPAASSVESASNSSGPDAGSAPRKKRTSKKDAADSGADVLPQEHVTPPEPESGTLPTGAEADANTK